MTHDTGVNALYQGLNEGAGGRSFDVLLLASDAAACEQMTRSLKEPAAKASN
jgi:hypothetical protein